MKLASLQPKHFRWEVGGSVGIVTLDRLDKKNPLTFDSYAELRDCFRTLPEAEDVDAVVITGAGENFCAGAAIAMASDLRLGTARAKVAFLFTRVGLAGCDMGACAMLPRIVGQGRAAELLF